MDRPEQTSAQAAEQVRAAREQARAARLFTLSQAAEVCGVSRSRIRRLLDAGAFPNAVQEDTPGKGTSAQVWRVPLADLQAAGLTPNRAPASPESRPAVGGGQGEQDAGQDLADLQHALDLERERRKAAEAIAAERERTIQGLETALRLLEASTTSAAGDASNAPTHGTGPQDATHGPQGLQEGVQEPPASLWARLRRRMG